MIRLRLRWVLVNPRNFPPADRHVCDDPARVRQLQLPPPLPALPLPPRPPDGEEDDDDDEESLLSDESEYWIV